MRHTLFNSVGKLCVRLQKVNASKLSVPKALLPGNVITTICGANSRAGQTLALQLKQCAFFKEIRLYDTAGKVPPLGTAVDLKHINTSCRVRAYCGPNQMKHAIKGAHVIIFIGGKSVPPGKPPGFIFEDNAEMVQNLSIQCSKHNPDAIIVVAVPPINSLVPVVAEVFRECHCLDPNKIIGCTTLDSVRMMCLVARKQGLAPSSIQVPIIGGSSPDTMVPVLSNAKPQNCFYTKEAEELSETLRCLDAQIREALKGKPLSVSPGYATALLVADITRGLTSLPHLPHCAYVRSDALQPLRYLATPLLFGANGVTKNFGVPKLNSLEVQLLERALPIIECDARRGEEYVRNPSTGSSVDTVMDIVSWGNLPR